MINLEDIQKSLKWKLESSNGIYKWASPEIYHDSLKINSKLLCYPRHNHCLSLEIYYSRKDESPIIVEKEFGLLFNSTRYRDSRFNFNKPEFVLDDLNEHTSIRYRKKLVMSLLEKSDVEVLEHGERFREVKEIALTRLKRKRDIWF